MIEEPAVLTSNKSVKQIRSAASKKAWASRRRMAIANGKPLTKPRKRVLTVPASSPSPTHHGSD